MPAVVGYGNNFVYNGEKYTRTNGFVTIDVNEKTNEGILVAEWDVKDWQYDTSKPAATGRMKVIWSDFFGSADYMDGGIAGNLYIHGDSDKEAPVLPTAYTSLTGWGAADVYPNGKKIYNDVVAHYMVTEGTRDPLTHVVVHTGIAAQGRNFPPFTMFMHINFKITAISTVSRL